jgi:hypothetical protein
MSDPKQHGVGFDARALGARQVRYRRGGGDFTTGDFNPAAQAFVSDGGGEFLRGAGPIDPAGYSSRYGGATPGVEWQGASAELLLDVGKVLGKAFAAGRLGSAADWTGNATWQECIDYAACFPRGSGPFAEFEFHSQAPTGSSNLDPIPVDDAGRPFGAVWQLPPPDGRFAINVHGGTEKPVLVVPPSKPPVTPQEPPTTTTTTTPATTLPPVPKNLLKDLAELQKLSGNVNMGTGRRAVLAQALRYLERVAKIAGEEH